MLINAFKAEHVNNYDSATASINTAFNNFLDCNRYQYCISAAKPTIPRMLSKISTKCWKVLIFVGDNLVGTILVGLGGY